MKLLSERSEEFPFLVVMRYISMHANSTSEKLIENVELKDMLKS